MTEEIELCHCSRPVVKEFHKDNNWCGDGPDVADCPEEHFSRGMCKHCDMVRCDAFPGACKPTVGSLVEKVYEAGELPDDWEEDYITRG